MKELMRDRLNKIEELEERQLLKQILNGVFQNLVSYTDEQMAQVRQVVFEEIEDETNQFDSFYRLVDRDDVDPISQQLFPILQEDLQELQPLNQQQLQMSI